MAHQPQFEPFGRWLLAHRRRLKFSQDATAASCGYSTTQWARFEKGLAVPPRDALLRISRALEADPAETFRLAGYLPPDEFQAPDIKELLDYYTGLPPICQHDMLSLAKQLYDNHVTFAARAARLSSAGRSATEPGPTVTTIMTAIGPFGLPANWQKYPEMRELVERLKRLGPPQESAPDLDRRVS